MKEAAASCCGIGGRFRPDSGRGVGRGSVGGGPREDGVMGEPTLYERLGGIFAIAAVIDNFSDRLRRMKCQKTVYTSDSAGRSRSQQ